MNNLSAWVKNRLANRPDSEHGQALVRIGLISLILAYALLPSSRAALAPGEYAVVLAIVLSGLANGLGIFAWLLVRPGKSHVRRALGMMADYGLMAAAMVGMGEALAWAYVVLMWVTVGNGLRYGNRYLVIAVAMACWIPVVALQIRMRKVAEAAERSGAPLPAAYDRMFHWWTGLGFGAFFAFLLIFWLMVAKALPWTA